MEPHVLGAGLYWLLLPCTLLAGELEGAGRKAASGTPALRRPAPRGCARASIAMRGYSPGLAAQGARIPEA